MIERPRTRLDQLHCATRLAAGIALATICAAARAEPIVIDVSNWRTDPKFALEIVRSGTVQFDASRLRMIDNERIEIKLPGEKELVLVKQRQEGKGKEVFVWNGRADHDEQSMATFAIVNEVASGTIALSTNRVLRLRALGDNKYQVDEVNPRKLPPEYARDPTPPPAVPPPPAPPPVGAPAVGEPGAFMPQDDSPANLAACDSGALVDVLVAYTRAAREAEGGKGQIEAAICTAEAETNGTYLRSEVPLQVRVVDMTEVELTTPLAVQAMEAITATDGVLKAVHQRRNEFGADVIVLVIESDTECGYSNVMTQMGADFEKSAFSIVSRKCLTGVLTFAHELGHVMGARHDDDVKDTPFPFNHGYVSVGEPGRAWYTIMATAAKCNALHRDDCARIPYWSNPEQKLDGDPLGAAERSNESRTLRSTAPTVANFRCSKPAVQGRCAR